MPSAAPSPPLPNATRNGQTNGREHSRPSAPATRNTDPNGPVERWRRVVDQIRARDPKLGAFLDHAEVLEMSAEKIELGFARDSLFYAEVTSKATHREIVEAAYSVFAARPLVEFQTQTNVDQAPPSTETVFARDKEARALKQREDDERARSHPVVLDAVRVLGARIKNIELPKTDS
jgi:hypothetical protein